jgi:hypothetical protein
MHQCCTLGAIEGAPSAIFIGVTSGSDGGVDFICAREIDLAYNLICCRVVD